MKGELGDLKRSVIAEMSEAPAPSSACRSRPMSPRARGSTEDDPYREGGSVFRDIRLANKGNTEARERLTHGISKASTPRVRP